MIKCQVHAVNIPGNYCKGPSTICVRPLMYKLAITLNRHIFFLWQDDDDELGLNLLSGSSN